MMFEPLFPVWLLMILVTSVTILFVGFQLRQDHRFRTVRITATVFMMLALTMLLLRPRYCMEKFSGIVLLTSGYSTAQVDSLLSDNRSLTLMHMEDVQPYKNSKQIASHELWHRGSEIEFVVGNGLSLNDLDKIHTRKFRLLDSGWPNGVTELHFSPTNIVNRRNLISGHYHMADDRVWLYLKGPAGKEDSVLLQGKGHHSFRLSFVPKQSGNFMYTLLIQDSTKTMEESIPLHVAPERPLKILFLQHYPTFEIQYLKTFLQGKNHSLMLRHQISKNNFRYEFINQDPVALHTLTSVLLENSDLMIADSESLSQLSPDEKKKLESAVRGGLGLLNVSITTNDVSKTFFPFDIHAVKKDTTVVSLNKKSFSVAVPQFRVTERSFVIPVLKNSSGVLSGYSARGAGKIGFQLLRETYPLTLSGDSNTYSGIWTPLLERMARSQNSSSKIKILSPFPWYENDPIDIQIISAGETTTLMANRVAIPLKEDLYVDNVWYGRTWGDEPGWHTLTTTDGSAVDYFISKPGAWTSLALTHQIKANALTDAHSWNESKITKAWKEVPPWIFYLVFLFAAGLLWLIPKM